MIERLELPSENSVTLGVRSTNAHTQRNKFVLYIVSVVYISQHNRSYRIEAFTQAKSRSIGVSQYVCVYISQCETVLIKKAIFYDVYMRNTTMFPLNRTHYHEIFICFLQFQTCVFRVFFRSFRFL